MDQQVMNSVNQLIQILIGGVISIACVYATAFVSKQIDIAKEKCNVIKDESARKITQDALSKIDNVITTNIVSAENILKPQIIQYIQKGEMSKEDLNNLSNIVKNNVLKQLSTDTLSSINGTISDVNGYVENRIELILSQLKDDANSSVQHTQL